MLLARASTGAWLNYAIPATVLAAALAGRGLARALDSQDAAMGCPARGAGRTRRAGVEHLRDQGSPSSGTTSNASSSSSSTINWKWPRSSYFFTDRPGINRVNGRLELVHDDWLYPVFESLRLAEPRSHWLGTAIVSGPVRAVVAPNDRSFIEGTTIDLRRLGFHSDSSLGPFFVWTR